MAKKKNIFQNVNALEKAHFLRIEKYAGLVEEIYNEAINEMAKLVKLGMYDKNKPFTFQRFPATHKKSLEIFQNLAQNVTAVIAKGEKDEWMHALQNNDKLIEQIFGTSRVGKELLARFKDRNLEALKSFQNRKVQGLGLSDRVWKHTEQFKQEMELGIDVALGDGRSASKLSRDLRTFLHDPDKLFRRVRDARGELHLSKSARAYSPGQGVYRSSYKNAMRLARTEINMAYRESDYHRWQQLDFIVGIEVRLSNNPNHCPMCAQLAGRYPKDFKFTGWHPHCRCSSVPILKTDEELDADIGRILNDKPLLNPDESDNAVLSMPPGYTQWVASNNQRILTAKSTPYFIRDNYKGGNINKGLRFNVANQQAKENFVPENLSRYEREMGVEIDKTIFEYLPQPVPLKNLPGGAHYNIVEKYVSISIDENRKRGKWKAQSVVYHEYGHAIDWGRDLHKSPEVAAIMGKYRKEWAKNKYARFKMLGDEVYDVGLEAYYMDNNDVADQAGALLDTIMSLNSNYGAGHSKAYFAQRWASEAEFIAHAFENKFLGNPVFKNFAPDLYQDMIDLIDQLLGIKKKP